MAGLDSTRKTNRNEGVFSLVLNLNDGSILMDTKDVIECYFIEDIFSMCMTGKLIFNDKYGIVENGPLTGNESVTLIYGEDEDREITFTIWKIGKIVQGNPSDPTAEQEVELFLVDEIFETIIMQRFSKSWLQKNVTDIIKDIWINIIGMENKILDIEESNYIMDFIMPYWTPMQTIKYLSKRCVSKNSNTSGYLCYNNTNEKFRINCKTFNYLLSTEAYLQEDHYVFEDNSTITKNKILEWWIDGLDRFGLKFIRGGHWKGYDSKRKLFIDEEYDYSDGIKDTVLLGKKSLFVDISSSNTTNVLLGDNDENRIKYILYDGWAKRYNMQNLLNIIVAGNESRHAGMQIEIEWPSAEREVGRYNKQMKGKYLVKSITHQLIGGENIAYRQRMVCIKNAMEESNHLNLINSVKKNLYSDKKGTSVK